MRKMLFKFKDCYYFNIPIMNIKELFYSFGLKLIDLWIIFHLFMDKWIWGRKSFLVRYTTNVIIYRREIFNIIVNYVRLKILHLVGVGYVSCENGYYHVGYIDHLGVVYKLRWKKSRGPKTQIARIFSLKEGEEIDITSSVEKFLGPDRSFPSLVLRPNDFDCDNIKIENSIGESKIVVENEIISF